MYLITGGCGFIGSHLADLLIQHGQKVRILDDLSNSTLQYLPREAEFVLGSITDAAVLKQALRGIKGIFHLAARVSVLESIERWYENHLVNQAGTVRILELAKGIPLIFASSAAVYGDASHLPHQETTLPNPLSPYANDKLASEMHMKLAWELYRTPSISCRFFNVYGPRQNPHSPYAGVIAKFIQKISCGEKITIYGDGHQKRDFIHVKDVVSMLYALMQEMSSGAHVYNICTGNAVSVNDLASMIGAITNQKPELESAPAKSGEIRISQGDPLKLLQEKGLKATVSLTEGLKSLTFR